VDDTLAAALEEAIADLGILLVQMDKFRARHADDARAIRAVCLAIGDRARRAHRHGALEAALAAELTADTGAARAALDAWLAAVRSGASYRSAVSALAARDVPRLQTGLVEVFDDVHVAPPPSVLYHPVVWQRRGRPRPAAELADDIARLRAGGIPGEDDASAPGVDPELPGVRLHATRPFGAPIHLALRGAALPTWGLVLGGSDEVVVPGARLDVDFSVGLADPDDEELDAWTLDAAAFRRDLAAALVARQIPIDEGVD
jgi:hypothetical protein